LGGRQRDELQARVAELSRPENERGAVRFCDYAASAVKERGVLSGICGRR